MLTANYVHDSLGPDPSSRSGMKRLWKIIAAEMSREDGCIGRSSSGLTAALAVNYCAARGLPFELTAFPGSGYSVRRLPPLERIIR